MDEVTASEHELDRTCPMCGCDEVRFDAADFGWPIHICNCRACGYEYEAKSPARRETEAWLDEMEATQGWFHASDER